MNKEWETSWAEWKVNKFVDLQTETMEATAIADHKKLLKYSKLLAVSSQNSFLIKLYCVLMFTK